MKKHYQKVWRKLNRKKKVSKGLTRHHNKAKSLGGTYAPNNIFMLTVEHHRAYHTLFGLRNFNQAIEVLRRLQEQHNEHINTEVSDDSFRKHEPAVPDLPEGYDTPNRVFKTRRVFRSSCP